MILPIDNQSLYEALKELQIIDKDVLDALFVEAKAKSLDLFKLLYDRDLLSEDNYGKVIEDKLKVPVIKLSQQNIPFSTLSILPEVVSKKNNAIVFRKDKDGIHLALYNPNDRDFVSFLQRKTGDVVKVYFATEKEIKDAQSLYMKNLGDAVSRLFKTNIAALPIIEFVDLLVSYAHKNHASDIHMEPHENECLVRIRVDGVMHDLLSYPSAMHGQIVTRIKVMSSLKTDEHLSAQDGKLQVKVEDEKLDIRVSIVPVVEGEKIVLRILSSHSRNFSLSSIGMSNNDIEKVKRGFNKPFGMVLSTGPTGSGKTTTIYSILKILNKREINIQTIEDPVEYEIYGINQIQVNNKTNLTFANGLRSILRQDPNVVFVGEIRDEETAGIAVNSALTGHLVLSTLHTNDAPTTLPRFLDMGVEPFLIASTINVVIGQRLLRKNCEKCKVSINIKKEDLAKKISVEIINKHFGIKNEITLYEGKGCEVCHNTGFDGRIGVFEVLEMTEGIKELVIAKSSSDEIKNRAIKEGMTTMFDDGMGKVVSGMTTIDEVLRVTMM